MKHFTKIFKYINSLFRKKEKAEKKRYACKKCARTYTRHKWLINHLRDAHQMKLTDIYELMYSDVYIYN